MVTSAGHPSPKLHSNKETPNSLFPASSASAGSSHSHEIRNDLWVIVTFSRTTPSREECAMACITRAMHWVASSKQNGVFSGVINTKPSEKE